MLGSWWESQSLSTQFIGRPSSFFPVFLTWFNLSLFAGTDPTHEGTAEGMENMADAVTHARFVGTDPASDEVVLMKILQVCGREEQVV